MSEQMLTREIERDPVDAAIHALRNVLGRDRDDGGLSTGDLAELRRMDPLGPALPASVWRLLTRSDVGAAISALGGAREAAERAFAIVIQAMAEAGAQGDVGIGTALGETGYAEHRLVLLLRARDPADIARQAREAARWCAVKGVRLRFGDRYAGDGMARFVLAAATAREADADRRAHAIARDYFATIQRDATARTPREV